MMEDAVLVIQEVWLSNVSTSVFVPLVWQMDGFVGCVACIMRVNLVIQIMDAIEKCLRIQCMDIGTIHHGVNLELIRLGLVSIRL